MVPIANLSEFNIMYKLSILNSLAKEKSFTEKFPVNQAQTFFVVLHNVTMQIGHLRFISFLVYEASRQKANTDLVYLSKQFCILNHYQERVTVNPLLGVFYVANISHTKIFESCGFHGYFIFSATYNILFTRFPKSKVN